jgi:endoglucanase
MAQQPPTRFPRPRIAVPILALFAAACSGDLAAPHAVPSESRSPKKNVVASVEVLPEAVVLAPGEATQLTARAYDASGNEVWPRRWLWSTDDASVAVVSGGRVEAIAVGATRIVATADGVSGSAGVDVVAPEPPPPPPPMDGSPFADAAFFVDPRSNARRQADEWYATRPEDALELEKIAGASQADWFGDWSGDVRRAVDERTTEIVAAGALPVFVAYNIPQRDCGSYSAGGAGSADAYRRWIDDFAAGLRARRAAVVLEPDALAGLDCLNATGRERRLELLRYAVQALKAAGAAVYIDAGHPYWHAASTMADRLRAAGIAAADGFALNVSNFHTTTDNASYGERVSALVGDAPFVIDSSRNGLGSNGEWCNPDGRALGTRATGVTGHPLVHAFLWIKRPGESDGTCNGGPSAGSWWADYALGLARRTPTTLAAR